MVLLPLTYRWVGDGVLNVVNSFARAWRGPPRGGAVEGLVEEEAGSSARARELFTWRGWMLNAVNSIARAGRGLPRVGAVEGMVDEEALEDETESSAHIEISFARQPVALPRERRGQMWPTFSFH
jgi:hypothetical protein